MEWIKVSDRLPEKNAKVLCTIELRGSMSTGPRVVETASYGKVGGEDGFVVWDDYYQDVYLKEAVIAWMPWPEPYNDG